MKKMLIALFAVLTIGANLAAACGCNADRCCPDGGRGDGYARGTGQVRCAWTVQDCCRDNCGGCNC